MSAWFIWINGNRFDLFFPFALSLNSMKDNKTYVFFHLPYLFAYLFTLVIKFYVDYMRLMIINLWIKVIFSGERGHLTTYVNLGKQSQHKLCPCWKWKIWCIPIRISYEIEKFAWHTPLGLQAQLHMQHPKRVYLRQGEKIERNIFNCGYAVVRPTRTQTHSTNNSI